MRPSNCKFDNLTFGFFILVLSLSNACARSDAWKGLVRNADGSYNNSWVFPRISHKISQWKSWFDWWIICWKWAFLPYFTWFSVHFDRFHKNQSPHGFSDCIACLNYLWTQSSQRTLTSADLTQTRRILGPKTNQTDHWSDEAIRTLRIRIRRRGLQN